MSWRQQKSLARLHEELRTIALFDRLHDYATDPDPDDNHAYVSRQTRRSEIMAEIIKLSANNPEYRYYALMASSALVLCLAFFYLLR